MVNLREISPDGIIVGVDASRNRSGGAIAYLIGLIAHGNPLRYRIREVHLWAYKSLLDSIPDRSWLVKHNPIELERSIFWQIYWQAIRLPVEATKIGCHVMFNTDAATFSPFTPSVTLSQDMLSYEPGEIQRYGLSKSRIRLLLLRYIQNHALRRSTSVIFLTKHASKMIQLSCGHLSRVSLIPHGVGNAFQNLHPIRPSDACHEGPIKLLYVSNVAPYKHQWMVVSAAQKLRSLGYDVHLTLVGGGHGAFQAKLIRQMKLSDPHGVYIVQEDFVSHSAIPAFLRESHIFVFASSCENMPITLLEGMAAGLPIACSDRGPMPEVLADAGVYFDPESPGSIVYAIRRLIDDPSLRNKLSSRAKQKASQYTWERCSNSTWTLISETYSHSLLK